MPDWIIYIASPLVGFAGMVGGGYWGVGCGWIVVPVMLILGYDPLQAVGIGLLQMVPSTLMTVVKQTPQIGWSHGKPGITLVLPLGIAAFFSSFLGKSCNAKLLAVFGSGKPLQWIFIFFIAFIAVQTLCSRTACYGDAMPEISRGKSAVAFAVGLVTGFVSSLLGLGGGIVTRPVLTSGFHVPEYYTSRIVRLLVLVTTSSGGLTYLLGSSGFQWTVLKIALCVSLGGMVGFPLGAKMHKIVYDAGYAQHIHKSYASVAVILPVNMLLNIYGYKIESRVLMVALALLLCSYLFVFTYYARIHPKKMNGAL